MIRALLILIMTMALTASLTAQSVPDSSSRRSGEEKPFIDKDGDGIPDGDGNGSRMQNRRRATVRFIDKNGDGICDGREEGLGFGRRRTEGMKPSDTKSDGKPRRGRQ